MAAPVPSPFPAPLFDFCCWLRRWTRDAMAAVTVAASQDMRAVNAVLSACKGRAEGGVRDHHASQDMRAVNTALSACRGGKGRGGNCKHEFSRGRM